MKQSTIFVIIYAVLILTLVSLLGWWAYDTYYPKPTPLRLTTEPEPTPSSGDYIQEEPADGKAAETVDPTLKTLFPFQTAPIESGFRIGTIEIKLTDLLSQFSTLQYNTSRDISDLDLWQQAAQNVSRKAIILDEAVKRGYKLPESDIFDQENIDAATAFLTTNLQSTGGDATIDSLVAARNSDQLVLRAK